MLYEVITVSSPKKAYTAPMSSGPMVWPTRSSVALAAMYAARYSGGAILFSTVMMPGMFSPWARPKSETGTIMPQWLPTKRNNFV